VRRIWIGSGAEGGIAKGAADQGTRFTLGSAP
jgi:hypothetical protein